MRRLAGNIFEVNGNCFNSKTLELFSLESEYLRVLGILLRGEDVEEDCEKGIAQELRAAGFLDKAENAVYEDFNPQFTSFRLVLGDVCNLKCRNCFVLNRPHGHTIMSKEDLKMVLESTFKWGKDKELKYHFFGGEPILTMARVQQAVAMIEEAVRSGVILSPVLTMTTNGTLITKEIAKYFAEHSIQVGISIDGPEAVNDAIRGTGTYQLIKRGYQILRENGVDRSWFLVTPYADTMDILPDFLESLAKEHDLYTLTINSPFEGNDLTWTVDGKKFAWTLLECHKRLKDTLQLESAVAPIIYSLSTHMGRDYACSITGGDVMASVSPDGRISFCAQYWGSDIFPDQFKDGAVSHWQINKPESCRSCIAERVCGGPCLINFQKTGKMDPGRCGFYQEFLKCFLEDPYSYMEESAIGEEEVL